MKDDNLPTNPIFDAIDSMEMQDAANVYQQFDRKNMQSNVDNAKKYVDEVKKLCISCDVQSPLIDAMIDIEKMNINLLCKQVFYAMHAIDSIFEKIDAQGGGLGDFALMIKLQNDAMHLVQSYISFVRQLPHVIAAFNRNMIATQDSQDVTNEETVKGQIAANVDVLVTRSVTDMIKAAESHVDTFEKIKDETFKDDDDLKPMFEMSPEAKELYDTEKYVDKPTYAEIAEETGVDFDKNAELSKQAKKEADIK